MLNVGNFVIHPMFPSWGRGIIAEIFFDKQRGIHIARVMWQSLDTDKLPFHTLNHLQPFVDTPATNNVGH